MAETSDKSGVSVPTNDRPSIVDDRPEKSGATPPSSRPTRSGTNTRPVQVSGSYPVRQVTWFQISNSDLRSIGVAQATATFFSALGTFALSQYLEFNKDASLLMQQNKLVPSYLSNFVELAFWSWVVFWLMAVLAFFWHRSELGRIKEEHGVFTLSRRIRRWAMKQQAEPH